MSSFARKPVKVTMTGPHLLAAVAYDEYYNDTPGMMADFGKLLRQNFRKLDCGRMQTYPDRRTLLYPLWRGRSCCGR